MYRGALPTGPVPVDPLQFLVFGSHKTATQTLTHSLRNGGFSAVHVHTLTYPGAPLRSGELAAFAARDVDVRGPLRVVSVFREPVDRLVSSMFQWYGVGALRSGEVARIEDTLIARLSLQALRRHFVDEYAFDWAGDEAIDEIAAELGIAVGDLRYDDATGHGLSRHGDCDVHLLRFDRFARAPARALERIAGVPLRAVDANRAEGKWYEEKYRAFRASLRLPPAFVAELYARRRPLVELFHPEGFDAALAAATARYAG